MASKKLKKILMAGAAAAALSAARNKSLLAATEDGKGGIDTIQKAKQAMTSDAAMKDGKGYKDSIMRGGAGTKAGSIGMGQKIKNFLTKEVIKIPKTPGSENFGLGDMDGAKNGKMVKKPDGKKQEDEYDKYVREIELPAPKDIRKEIKNLKRQAMGGEMIKANHGVMVEARGNKLARSKPTKTF
jgi:hypothetical protein